MNIDLDWSQRGYKPEPEPNWRSLYETLNEYNNQCLEAIEQWEMRYNSLLALYNELSWMMSELQK